jgi:hypothetical protein
MMLTARTGVEMTSDRLFAGRIRRLTAVSSVALGVITILAFDAIGWRWGAAVMIGLGWITMPVTLAASLRRPPLRYLLVLPSSLVSIGVLGTALTYSGGGTSLVGWWMITAGIGLGASLGMWFWYRWAPVPARLDGPFSAARWGLIAIHVALVFVGALLVFAGSLS